MHNKKSKHTVVAVRQYFIRTAINNIMYSKHYLITVKLTPTNRGKHIMLISNMLTSSQSNTKEDRNLLLIMWTVIQAGMQAGSCQKASTMHKYARLFIHIQTVSKNDTSKQQSKLRRICIYSNQNSKEQPRMLIVYQQSRLHARIITISNKQSDL